LFHDLVFYQPEAPKMDLSKFLNILYRYLWLFVVIVLIASLTTFFVVNNQPESYRARAKLLVGPSLDSPSPDINSLKIGGQLILTYSELVTTNTFLQSVNERLDPAYQVDLDTLDAILAARQNTETRVLTITATTEDPKKSLAIANAAAQTLVDMSPSKDNTTALLREQMSTQSHQVEDIVSKAEASIQQLEGELTALKDAKPLSPDAVQANLDQQNLIIKQLSDERSRLSDALRTLATIYSVLLDTNTNQVEIIEPAQSVTVLDQNLWLRVGTSAISGLVLALIIVFLIEYMDDKIRFPGEFKRVTDVPVLSVINKHANLDGSGINGLIAFSQPGSQAANSYREVVAKLLYSIGEKIPYTLMLTSVGSQSGDDTAVTTGNLAVSFANAGSRVILLDSQFHNPVLTKIFKADGKKGLSDYMTGEEMDPNVVPVDEIHGIRFVPAGLSTGKGSSSLLNSVKLSQLLEALKKDADIILLAGSSIPWFAESLNVASHANSVILVAQRGEAHSRIVNKAVENLRSMQVPIDGVLFDYNPSPFASEEVDGKVSPVERFKAKVAPSKAAGTVEKNNVAEQMTKS
jgi:capsular polysaccharide biosynthesis protein/Mrp family chromosome partitioning ATPase